MRSFLMVALVLTGGLALCLGCIGCGGGGGGPGGFGGVTTSSVGGSWLGPTGSATPAGNLTAPGGGGLQVDPAGNATGSMGLVGLTGKIEVRDPFKGVFSFTGDGASTGIDGIVLMYPFETSHMLLMLSDGRFAALEKDATMLVPPYTDPEFRSSVWNGLASDVDPAFTSVDAELVANVAIDAAGMFTLGTTTSGVMPLAVTDSAVGVIGGDYNDPTPPPEMGQLLALLTPDRKFLAVMSCPSTALLLSECSFAALARQP
jgi:hypothetical protein